MKAIIFQGEEYVFGGDSLDESGFIAKRDDFEHGRCSFAHYYPDERGVKRFGQKIGSRADIRIIGDSDATPDGAEALINMFTDPSWPDVGQASHESGQR